VGKQGGLGDNLYVDGVDVSGDIGSLSRISGSLATLDLTAITQFAHERRGGIRDGAIEFSSFFNDDAGETHDVLSDLPTTDRIVTYSRGTALGGWAASVVAKQINYDPTRAADGALTNATQAQANGYGLEWGKRLTAGIAVHESNGEDGTGVDGGASSAFGLQAWLHVFDFDGTDATISLEQSSDDGSTDAYAAVTDGAFTQVTSAPFSERIQTARDQAVERYLRVSSAGTFTSISFVVAVTRNLTEVTF
jgi:hypothetical protein